MPMVIRKVLPEGGDSSRLDGSPRIPFKNDEHGFFRRYADDVREEFRRAMRRRRFFTFWSPDMESV